MMPKEDKEVVVRTNIQINEVEFKLVNSCKKIIFKESISIGGKRIFRIPTAGLFEYCNKNSVSPKFKIKLHENK